MITIPYTVTGSYLPFLVILRNTDTNELVDSAVVHQPSVVQNFVNVPLGNYQIEAYDAANGVAIVVPDDTSTTTTVVAPTTPSSAI